MNEWGELIEVTSMGDTHRQYIVPLDTSQEVYFIPFDLDQEMLWSPWMW